MFSSTRSPFIRGGVMALLAASFVGGVAVAGAAGAVSPAATGADPAAVAAVSQPTSEQAAIDAAAAAQAKADAAWHTPVATYVISSYYAESRGDGPHMAIDLAGPEGQDVFAARSGTVVAAGWEDGYGFTVTIDHGDGHTTKYGHMMSQPLVSAGQHVSGGQPIGYLGTTGDSTGPHLHLELKLNGASIDPSSLIPMVDSTMPAGS